MSDVLDGRCTLHARLSTNSCGIGHGNSHHVEHTDSCMVIHASSGGANAHGNSRMESGLEVPGETKTSSMGALSGVWRPAVGENLPLQQASESLHEEACLRAVRLGSPRVREVRGHAVDPADGGDVHLYRDSSLAPLLDLRRRLKLFFF